VATSGPDLATIDFFITADIGSLIAGARAQSIIAIDIPIGLPENEPRACDIAARALLGWPRGSSVFSPPSRRALRTATYSEALRLNREALGIGISKQAFFIMPKILVVDESMSAARQHYVREVHPEVAFAQLNGAPMLHNKKRPEGRADRLAVLQKNGLDISATWLAQERSKLGAARVSTDDLLDALACLMTASYIREGRSRSLGRADQRDAKGLIMEIVTCSLAVPT
jgi:predicted RNase H-like nuclease